MIKAILIILMILVTAVPAMAVRVVCDPQAGVTSYNVTGPSWAPGVVPAEGNGSINMNVDASLEGTNSFQFAACIDDVLWGRLCSTPTPFSYVRPSNPVAPSGTKLAK
jgi:hypothetical protein